ncbi:ABC transporter permease [uncultured Oscillibacter sp.]|uniref:ABC transporter permease n=1 Tax=uncultured Oscillibacter sp. TaxID=876091 RepID=UPI0025F98359|nr:ABC transporter permease subunit [uncultured Oscillibacter sp.]
MKRGKRPFRLWAVLFWLLCWQGAAAAMAAAYPAGHLLLASPISALRRLGELAVTGEFWSAVCTSAVHIFGGFAVSCLLAVVLAALSARFSPVRELVAPLAAAVKAVPVVSFIILALVWVDGGSLSLLISGLMAFPTVYGSVLTGIVQTDRQLLEMAQVFRVPWRRQLWGIWLPSVLPYFRSAVSLAMGLCWKSGVAAEVIGLRDGTVGERLYSAKVYFQTADLFAWTAVIVVLSAVMERLFLRGVDALAGKVGAA